MCVCQEIRHYTVDILPEKVYNFDFIEHFLIFDTEEERSKLVKLHEQFGH